MKTAQDQQKQLIKISVSLINSTCQSTNTMVSFCTIRLNLFHHTYAVI